jgi:uncharacterized hydrophobic protein (TIGR00271 family)
MRMRLCLLKISKITQNGLWGKTRTLQGLVYLSGMAKWIQALRLLKDDLKDRFSLHEDQADELETIEQTRKGAEFRGFNLWVLIFAILIASIGLNVNSVAVIIGAMLISPLMAPIMSVGMGIGIWDLEMLKKGLRNLAFATLVSVLVSTLYFWISPLKDSTPELIARTTPTIWDLLIALFGGLAGIVASSRRDKSNAIPGVAIATALMPPLCTVGYGIANGEWSMALGAFFLYYINSVFISLSTFGIVRLLNYPKVQHPDAVARRRIHWSIQTVVWVAIIPSFYIGWQWADRSWTERIVRTEVQSFLEPLGATIIKQDWSKKDSQYLGVYWIAGRGLDSTQLNRLKGSVELLTDHKALVEIRQGFDPNWADLGNREEVKWLKQTQVYQRQLDSMENSLDSVRSLLDVQKRTDGKWIQIQDESRILFPGIVWRGHMVLEGNKASMVLLSQGPKSRDSLKFQEWLRKRTGDSTLRWWVLPQGL